MSVQKNTNRKTMEPDSINLETQMNPPSEGASCPIPESPFPLFEESEEIEDIRGKVVVITGGTRGIGAAAAQRFAREGAQVAILSGNAENLKAARTEFLRRQLNVYPFICDITLESHVEHAASTILDTLGTVDILINNAGTGLRKTIEETTPQDFDRVMNTNIRGAFLMTRSFLPVMKQKRTGHIVNIASIKAVEPTASLSAYAASKSALANFSSVLYQEVKEFGIKVSVFYPGAVNTRIHEELDREYSQETLAKMIQPGDIAETIFHTVTRPKRYLLLELHPRPFLR